MCEIVKSPLNYVGTKYKLMERLKKLFPNDISTFYDVFCGSGTVYLNTDSRNYSINDNLKELSEIHRFLLSNDYESIIEDINEYINYYNLNSSDKECYKRIKSNYNNGDDRNTITLLTMIYYSFNNMIRFNKKGEFNVSSGYPRKFSKVNQLAIKKYKEITQDRKINVYSMDFHTFIRNVIDFEDTSSFVYLDPPYLITCATYNQNWKESTELLLYKDLDMLNSKEIKFGLSNVIEHKGRTNDILKEWSSKYNIHYLDMNYDKCSYHNNTKNTQEVFITNF